MTKSRDTADSINRIDSSAANATAITIDANENVLVGKTSTSNATTTVGFHVQPEGVAVLTRDGGAPLRVSRKTSAGEVLSFHKDGVECGVIGVDGRLGIGTGDTGLYFNDTLDFIGPLNAGTLAYRDNAIDLGYSAYRFKDLYLGGGAYLGGTASANHLDDYEEGTWTPTVATGTVTTATGNYTKIGRVVHITGIISGFSNRTSSSAVLISGLPFSVGVVDRAYPSGFIARDIDQSPDTAYFSNATTFSIYASGTTGDYESVRHNELNAATSAMYFSATYYA